jgi:hypothetical protein
MKKLLLFSALAGLAFAADAQSTTNTKSTSDSGAPTYHQFKVDVDLGYASPSSGNGTKAGATFTIEPHYRLSDDFALGLRVEGAALGYETINTSGNKKIKASLLTSFSATADYYLANGGFRPFIGGGAGFYTVQAVAGNSESGTVTTSRPGSTNFGFFPRIGFEASHFRLSGAYNVVGNSSNYASITIGFFLGGGKK